MVRWSGRVDWWQAADPCQNRQTLFTRSALTKAVEHA